MKKEKRVKVLFFEEICQKPKNDFSDVESDGILNLPLYAVGFLSDYLDNM